MLKLISNDQKIIYLNSNAKPRAGFCWQVKPQQLHIERHMHPAWVLNMWKHLKSFVSKPGNFLLGVFHKIKLTLLYLSVVSIIGYAIWTVPESLITSKELSNPKELIDAQNELRKIIAQVVGGMVLLFGVYLTYRRIRATEENVLVAQKNLSIAQEGQI